MIGEPLQSSAASSEVLPPILVLALVKVSFQWALEPFEGSKKDLDAFLFFARVSLTKIQNISSNYPRSKPDLSFLRVYLRCWVSSVHYLELAAWVTNNTDLSACSASLLIKTSRAGRNLSRVSGSSTIVSACSWFFSRPLRSPKGALRFLHQVPFV